MKRMKIVLVLLVILLVLTGCRKTLYSIAIAVDGEGEIEHSVDLAEIPEGTEVTLKAVPEAGWQFLRWSGDASGSNAEIAVTVSNNLSFSAEFTRKTVEVSVEVQGSGTVLGRAMSEVIFAGDAVVLTAEPESGWEFSGWSGSYAGTENPLELQADEDLELTALFSRISVAVASVTRGSGTITISPSPDDGLYVGDSITIAAAGNAGWHFTGWEGAYAGRTNPFTIEAEAEEVRLVASFARDNEIAWRLPLGDEIFSTAAVEESGTIYIGSENGALTAVTPDGNRLWSYQTGGGIKSSPAIGPDGTIYFGSKDKWFYALSPDGELRWRFQTGGSIVSSPAVGPDGTIYFGSGDRNLYALSPDGSVRWQFQSGSMISSSPAVSNAGIIYFGSLDKYLYALTPEGELAWRLRTPIGIETSPALAENGTVYFGSSDRTLYAVSPEGRVAWQFPTGGEIFSSPVVGPDGTIYFGSDDYFLYAVKPDGTELWKFRAGSIIAGSPLVGASGTVYTASDDSFLYAVGGDGSLLWKIKLGDSVYASPAMGPDGTLYIGALDGKLYSLSMYYETAVADAAWPKFRKNLSNTAK